MPLPFIAALLACALLGVLVALLTLWKLDRQQRRRTGLDVSGMGRTDEGFYYIKPVPLTIVERAKLTLARILNKP